jgi:hypothetical protein
VRAIIRGTFASWETLPDAIQTDNEVCLGGQPIDPAPSRLTLWLAGLGVAQRGMSPTTRLALLTFWEYVAFVRSRASDDDASVIEKRSRMP